MMGKASNATAILSLMRFTYGLPVSAIQHPEIAAHCLYWLASLTRPLSPNPVSPQTRGVTSGHHRLKESRSETSKLRGLGSICARACASLNFGVHSIRAQCHGYALSRRDPQTPTCKSQVPNTFQWPSGASRARRYGRRIPPKSMATLPHIGPKLTDHLGL